MKSVLWLAWLALGACACGDSGAGAGGAGGGGGAGAGGGAASPCDDGTLCLDVQHEGDLPGGARLTVVWFRLEDQSAFDPSVALDQPFGSDTQTLEIALADLTDPPDIDQLCERACADAATCPCTGEVRAAVAYVLVIQDGNESGAIEPSEVAAPALGLGIANTAVVWSTATGAAPAPYDALFPEGVREGTAPYRIEGGEFLPADSGERFELTVGGDAT